jgi:hypothetical protein
MTMMWWLWVLRAQLTLSKLLEVSDRAALLPHYSLLFTSPFWKGDFFDIAHIGGLLLALTGF